jgi:hypothetical protein
MSTAQGTDAFALRRQQLALLFRAVDTKARCLADELHPSWRECISRDLGLSPALGRRGSALLSAAFELRWPSLAELREPVHRISLLGREQTVRVLALHALYAWHERVRVSIGREVRDFLVALVGGVAYGQLVGEAPSGLRNVVPLGPQELDADMLAAAGFRSLCRSGAWASRDAMAITRLSLPPPAVKQAAALEEGATATAAQRPLKIDEYFPELTWLFGSDMDHSLSA